MERIDFTKYLTQGQLDSLGEAEVDTLLAHGCVQMVTEYRAFLKRSKIDTFWSEWQKEYDNAVEFPEHAYFKAWLIIVSIVGESKFVDIAAHFINVLEADFVCYVKYGAPLGFTSSVAAYSQVSPNFPELCRK